MTHELRMAVRVARAIVTKTDPRDMVVELVNSGRFRLREAWLVVDAMQEKRK